MDTYIFINEPILVREGEQLGLLIEFSRTVCGFADSISLLKKKMPDKVKKIIQTVFLTEVLFGKNAAKDMHNAIAVVAIA